jgi:hypothetical protein
VHLAQHCSTVPVVHDFICQWLLARVYLSRYTQKSTVPTIVRCTDAVCTQRVLSSDLSNSAARTLDELALRCYAVLLQHSVRVH